MKKTRDTQKPCPDHAQHHRCPRKLLRLGKETLRSMNGGSGGPVLDSPCVRPSQCPTLCF